MYYISKNFDFLIEIVAVTLFIYISIIIIMLIYTGIIMLLDEGEDGGIYPILAKLQYDAVEFLLDKYVFRWDEIPGNDDIILKEFLTRKFGVHWVETTKFKKHVLKKIISRYNLTMKTRK